MLTCAGDTRLCSGKAGAQEGWECSVWPGRCLALRRDKVMQGVLHGIRVMSIAWAWVMKGWTIASQCAVHGTCKVHVMLSHR